MTRYRLLYNGDHWRVQWKGWLFWHWLKERTSYDFADSISWVMEFTSDESARVAVQEHRLKAQKHAAYNAPFTLSIEVREAETTIGSA